jgi:thymidylate synthase (FAD)
MQVKLISITQSVVEDLTPEELIVYVARVSNPSNQLNKATAERLIRYIIKHKHWSPFEMVDMTVEIKTSLAIATQILRHRSFCFQQFSARYSEVVDVEPLQLREQAEKNRQSSANPITDAGLEAAVSLSLRSTFDLYKRLLDEGVAKECARMILPQTSQTTLYMKGSIRSWIHYLDIRCQEDTQLEHRQVAEAIRGIFNANFPVIAKAMNHEG